MSRGEANGQMGRQIMRDKVVIVTGGFGILGRAVGEAAVGAGCSVALVDRGSAAGIEKNDRLMTFGEVDLTDFTTTARAFETVAARFGRIDGLANVAGGFRWQTVEGGDLEAWFELFKMNLMTAVSATKAALPFLRASHGAVVNISAAPARKAGAGMGAYAASKAGVLKLTESIAEELKEAGVRVNAILPTIIDTPRNRADMPKADYSKWVAPAELAKAILFLLSDEASAITGAELLVAGKS
jgi:NAD(P)-dependent dehydrogenase (short-subunit alcohol dehydrogenase family)